MNSKLRKGKGGAFKSSGQPKSPADCEDLGDQVSVRRKVPSRQAELSEQQLTKEAEGRKLGKSNQIKVVTIRDGDVPDASKIKTQVSTDAKIKLQVRRESTGSWKSTPVSSKPMPNHAVNSASDNKTPNPELLEFRRVLFELCKIMERSPPIFCIKLKKGMYTGELRVGNEDPVEGGRCEYFMEAQGSAAKAWLAKHQPDWRQVLDGKPSMSTSSKCG